VIAEDMIMVGVLIYFLIWAYQPKLMSINFPIAYFGIVAALITAADVLVLKNISRIEKIVKGKKNYVFISAFLPGLCYIIIGMNENWIIVITTIIVGAGFGWTRRAPMISYINKYVESSNRATVLSFVNLTKSLLLAIINPIVGKAMDISLNNTLIMLGALLMVAAIVSRVEENMLLD
jgi:sugar phosphate permease